MEEVKKENLTNMNNDSKNKNTYNWGLDIIRVVAMFFVILVHSTSFYGFDGVEISSVSTFFAGVGRYLSFSCIPLFLILTGYLNSNKTPNAKYYLKLLKIFIEYLLCGIFVFFINRFCFDEAIGFGTFLIKMLTFEYLSYSWYINMFVGLFLFAPFFNYLYKAIPEKCKWWFIITLLLVFSYPHITSYWTSAYPIMYYFIGVFLKDKQFKIKKYILALCIVGICIIQTLIARFQIPIYSVENHNNLGCVLLSVSIFLLLSNLTLSDNNSVGLKIVKPLRIIANASLSTFLISEIFENFTAQMFAKLELVTFVERLPYLAYLTPLKFVLSVMIGLIITLISLLLYKLIIKCVTKIIKKSEEY